MTTGRNIGYVTHAEFEQHVQNVASGFNAVDRRFDEIKKSLDHLGNKFDSKTETSWPLLISGLGLVLSVIIAVGALVWWGMSGRVDAISSVINNHIEQPGHLESLRNSGIMQEKIIANFNALEDNKKDTESIRKELNDLIKQFSEFKGKEESLHEKRGSFSKRL